MKTPRLTARARLTLTFLGLFVLLGTTLLAVNYQLLATNLDKGSVTSVVAIDNRAKAIDGGQTISGSSGVVEGTAKPNTGSGPSVTVDGKPVDLDPSPANGTSASSLIAEYRTKALNTLLRISVLSLGGVTVVAGLVVWLVARRTLRPLRSMSAATNRITEKNLEERLPLAEPQDELRELASTFNAMMDRLAAAFAHERRLVANASHELGTPIANQRMVLEVALDDPGASADDLRGACRTALEESERAERLLRGMLTMARADQAEIDHTPTRLDQVVTDELGDLSLEDLDVETHLTEVIVQAEPFLLGRLVHNLLRNASEHNVPGGWMRADLADDAGCPRLRVSNSCAPIDPDLVVDLTEPFRRGTGDRTGSDRGSGLGLAIAKTIAVAHGWALQVSAADDVFEVTVDFLPAPPPD